MLPGHDATADGDAGEDAEVAAIDGERFLGLLETQPALGTELARTASRRLIETRLRHHLGVLFPSLTSAGITEAITRAEFVTLAPGQVLFREDDPADDAYVVVTGRVRVLRYERDGTISQPVAEIGAGELIGERALLDDQHRSASVVAARRTRLARFPRATFEALMLEHPQAMLAVTRRLVQRQLDARTDFARALSGRSSVAFVPIHHDLDVTAITAALDTELHAHTSVRHLDSAGVDAAVGFDGAARADRSGHGELRIERYLDEVEATTDLVLLVADAQARDRFLADGLADLHVQFELQGVPLLDFDVVAPVVERGYAGSIDQLRAFAQQWRALDGASRCTHGHRRQRSAPSPTLALSLPREWRSTLRCGVEIVIRLPADDPMFR